MVHRGWDKGRGMDPEFLEAAVTEPIVCTEPIAGSFGVVTIWCPG